MTGSSRPPKRAPLVEFRVTLEQDAADDLRRMSKVSGLAATQYLRSLYLAHRAKIYAPKDDKR